MTTGAALAITGLRLWEHDVFASSGKNVPTTGVTWLGTDLATVWPGWTRRRALHCRLLAGGFRSH